MGNPSDITKIKTETKPKDINFDLDYLIKKTSPNEKPIKNIDSETLDFNVENMLNKPKEVENKPGHITHMNEGIHRPKEEVPNVTPSTSSSDVLAKEGEIVHIDLGKISTSAKGALNGEFVNKSKLNKPSWENNNLLYKIRDDGAVAIFHEGVIIGFTTQDAIKGENVENINLTSHPADNQGITKAKSENGNTDAPLVSNIKIEDEQTTKIENVAHKTIDNSITPIKIPNGYGTDRSFMGWHKVTTENSLQLKLKTLSGENFDENGYGKIGNNFVVATTPKFGNIGDIIEVKCGNGTFSAIIGDTKNINDPSCNEWGHNNGKNVIEFIGSQDWYNEDSLDHLRGATIIKNTYPGNYTNNVISIKNTGQNYFNK